MAFVSAQVRLGASEGNSQTLEIRGNNCLFILKLKHTIGSLANLFFFFFFWRDKNSTFCYKLAEQIQLVAKDFFSSLGYLDVVVTLASYSFRNINWVHASRAFPHFQVSSALPGRDTLIPSCVGPASGRLSASAGVGAAGTGLWWGQTS